MRSKPRATSQHYQCRPVSATNYGRRIAQYRQAVSTKKSAEERSSSGTKSRAVLQARRVGPFPRPRVGADTLSRHLPSPLSPSQGLGIGIALKTHNPCTVRGLFLAGGSVGRRSRTARNSWAGSSLFLGPRRKFARSAEELGLFRAPPPPTDFKKHQGQAAAPGTPRSRSLSSLGHDRAEPEYPAPPSGHHAAATPPAAVSNSCGYLDIAHAAGTRRRLGRFQTFQGRARFIRSSTVHHRGHPRLRGTEHLGDKRCLNGLIAARLLHHEVQRYCCWSGR